MSPLQIKEIIDIIAFTIPLCQQMMFYAIMWSILSDRKDFESNEYVSKHKLYRWIGKLHPSVMSAYVRICRVIVNAERVA